MNSIELKISVVEKILLDISRLPGIGGYKAIEVVEATLLAIIESKEKAKQMKSYLINDDQFKLLMDEKINKDEFKIIQAKRSANRNTIQESIITILERGKGLITAANAKEMFVNLLAWGSITHLNKNEIDNIRAQRILDIDTGWVLQGININGWTILIDELRINPRQAIAFFEALSMKEKENLASLINQYKSLIKLHLPAYLKKGISYDDAISDLKQIIAGQESRYPGLIDTQLLVNKNLNSKFLDILPTEEFRLTLASENFIQSISRQATAVQQSLIGHFTTWSTCKQANVCPSIAPILPEVTQNFNGSLSQLSSEAQAIIGDYTNATVTRVNSDERKLLTQSLETWISCYLVTQSLPIAKEVCLSLWNATTTMIASSSAAVAHEVLQIAAKAEQPAEISASSHLIREEPSSMVGLNYNTMQAAGLLLFSVVGGVYVVNRYYTKPKQQENSALESVEVNRLKSK